MSSFWRGDTRNISWNLGFSPIEANARQRSGRAGRTGPGKCYRGKPRVVVVDWDRSCFKSKLCNIRVILQGMKFAGFCAILIFILSAR